MDDRRVQFTRAQELIPVVEKLAPAYGLMGWTARPFLDAESLNVVIRLYAELGSVELRFNARDVSLGPKDPAGLERLVRAAFASRKLLKGSACLSSETSSGRACPAASAGSRRRG